MGTRERRSGRWESRTDIHQIASPLGVRACTLGSMLVALCVATAVQAQDTTWIGPYDSGWSIAGNWDTGVVPDGSSYHAIIDANGANAASVILNGNYTVGQLTVDAGDLLHVSNGYDFHLYDATVLNNGTISLESTGSYTRFYLDGTGDTTFSGSGTCFLDNRSTNEIRGSASPLRLVNNAGHTFRGGGRLGSNQLTLTNAGLIQADQPTDLTVDLHTDFENFNTGTMQADAGGTLWLYRTALNNTGGLIQALDGSYVDLGGSTSITGGTVSSAGTGAVQVRSSHTAYIQDVTNSGHLAALNSASLVIRGTIDNQSLITLDSGGSYTYLYVDQPLVTLTGPGEVRLADSSANRLQASVATHRLVHTGGHLIHGGGDIGANKMLLTNEATIDADQPGVTMGIDLSGDFGANPNYNMGVMQASNGGILDIYATPLTNTGGLIQALDGSTVQLRNSTHIVDGTLMTSGSGLVTVTIGASARIEDVIIAGNLDVQNDGTLNVTNLITNEGTISTNSTGSYTRIYLTGADTVVDGSGQIVMGDHDNNQMRGDVSNRRLSNGMNHTIRGGGGLGANFLVLTNEGLIAADSPGVTMKIDLNGNLSDTLNTNTGIMQATNGGTLQLHATPLTNTNGLIEAQDGSTVLLTGSASIVDGTIDSSGTGSVIVGASQSAWIDNVQNTSSATVENSASLYARNSLVNDGSISITSGGSYTYLYTDVDNMILSGTGDVALGASSLNVVRGTSVTQRVTNTGSHTIHGGGQIGSNILLLTNESLIDANLSGITMEVDLHGDFGANPNINTGTMQASNGGTLKIRSTPLTNTGGLIQALAGSTVTLSGSADIRGGVLATVDDGTFQVPGSQTPSLTDLTLNGTYTVNNGASTYALGTIVNNGTMTIDSTGSYTYLYANSDIVTLDGSGEVVLPGVSSRIQSNGTTRDLVNGASHTIRGRGNIGANNMGLTNLGSIVADTGETLTIDVNTLDFDNQGLLHSTAGSTVAISSGTFQTSGTVIVDEGAALTRNGPYPQSAGETRVNGSLSITSGSADLTGGMLSGHGSIAADVTADTAIIEPSESGNTAGSLDVSGNVTLTNCTVNIEIGGNLADEYDQMIATGTMSIGGTLDVQCISGFVPNYGDSFTVMTGSGLSGTFDTYSLGSTGNPLTKFVVSYTADSVIVGVDYKDGVYIGPFGGSWFEPTNWRMNAIPDAATEVYIPTLVLVDDLGAEAVLVYVADSGELYVGGATPGSLTTPSVDVQGNGILSLADNALVDALSVTLRSGSTLTMLSAGAELLVQSMHREAGAVIEWHAGTITVNGGTYTQADPDLSVGGSSGLAVLNLINGAQATVTGNLTIGQLAGESGLVIVDGSSTDLIVEGILLVGVAGDGSLEVANGAMVSAYSDMMINGLVTTTGAGMLSGSVESAGAIHPGGSGSAGNLTITADYQQDAAGSLNIELGGTVPNTEHDVLDVLSLATLSGTLNVSLINGFEPRQGDRFDIVTSAALPTGTFTVENLPPMARPHLVWRVIYHNGGVTLVVTKGKVFQGGTPTFVPAGL